jgi:FkbM family methyltransferase
MRKTSNVILVICFFLITAFIPFSLLVGMASYSQLDCHRVPLDHKLIERIKRSNGFFIEAGANNGVTQSNTKLLEEAFGWKGILVEPSPVLFEQLKANRPAATCYQCALGSFEEDNTYIYGDFDGHLMSSVNGNRLHRNAQQKVLVRSIQSILDEIGITHIDFFSLDTEGYELNIIKGIDFNKITFDFLLIEIYPLEYDEIISYLFERGYTMVEEFSSYNPINNPGWDGTHNDYLFKRTELISDEVQL